MGHRYIITPGFLIFFCLQVFSQPNYRADSLKRVIATTESDSVKYFSYLHLTDHFLSESVDSSIFFLNQAESLAIAMKDTAKIAKVFRGFGFINEYILQLDDATNCFTDAAKLYSSVGDEYQMSVIFYRLANNCYLKGQYNDGLRYCDSAFLMISHTGKENIKELPQIYEIQGLLYQKSGNYPASMESLQKALTEWEKQKSSIGMASVYNNMGLIFLDQELDSLSLDYFHNFLRMSQEAKKRDFEGIAYINLGVAFSNLNQDSFALLNYEDALSIFEELNMPGKMVLLLNNIGALHRKQRNYEKSNEYLYKALDMIAGTDETDIRIHIYNNLGANFLSLNQPDQAQDYVHKNYELAMSKGSLSQKVEALELRTDFAKSNQNFEEALALYTKYTLYKDSLINQNSIQKTANIRHQFQLEKQEAESDILRREQAAQIEVIKIQRIFLTISILGMLLTIGLLIYLYSLFRFKKIANTKLIEQANDLKKAKEIAENASKAKAEFLSIMSHEIRTPMNAVIGMTHLLIDDSPRPDQMEYLNTLKFSGTSLLNLINDILDFSKIESGKLSIEHIDFNLHELIRGITHSLGIKGHDKNVVVKYHYDPDMQKIYNGDPVRLGQILTNLVGNAVKFTEHGSVELRVEKINDQEINFQVIDTGIGIPEDKQSLIFEQFSQSSVDTTRKYGGTGLGLTITKKLLNLMNTEIHLTSTPGKGSTFYFSLPLKPSINILKTMTEDSPGKPKTFKNLSGLRVLVAEDNKINQVIARKFLEKWEIQTVVVNDGQEVLEKIGKENFDVILMDIHMPELDGIETTRIIRKSDNPAIADLPIIALTASALEEEIKMILEAGMNDIVTKPFDPLTLYQMIARYHKLEEIESAA